MLGLLVKEAGTEAVYVVVTVSVTPVGNVVMLGVPVLSTDRVTDLEFVTVVVLLIGGEGLDDCDRDLRLVEVCDTEMRPVCDCLEVNETVVEEECDLLVLADGV